MVQPSHPYMTTGKLIADYMDLCQKSDVSAFYMLSRLVIAFLPRSKCLLISWLQSISAVILEPKKIKSVTISIVFPIYLTWNDGTRCNDLSFLDVEVVKKIFFFIEGIALQNFFLFSVKPQHESAIDTHISHPFWTSHPSYDPSHPSRLIQSPCLSFLSDTANFLWLFYIW